MNLVDLVMFLMTCAGITSGLVGASLLDRPRDFISSKSPFFEGLLSCPMCSGFWVGLIMSMYFGVNPIFGAFMSSCFSWAFYTFVDAASAFAAYCDNDNTGEE